jgi:hypothetical protein
VLSMPPGGLFGSAEDVELEVGLKGVVGSEAPPIGGIVESGAVTDGSLGTGVLDPGVFAPGIILSGLPLSPGSIIGEFDPAGRVELEAGPKVLAGEVGGRLPGFVAGGAPEPRVLLSAMVGSEPVGGSESAPGRGVSEPESPVAPDTVGGMAPTVELEGVH